MLVRVYVLEYERALCLYTRVDIWKRIVTANVRKLEKIKSSEAAAAAAAAAAALL